MPPDHAERLAKGTELFKKSVRSILSERCLNCHGSAKTRGNFDLSTRESHAVLPLIASKAEQ